MSTLIHLFKPKLTVLSTTVKVVLAKKVIRSDEYPFEKVKVAIDLELW